jgi:aryl-alcohol dehydrogenase-like predicted oxidoreductase
MKYRYLGKSGLKVSRVCLGTMTFGQENWGCDKETSIKIIDKFIDYGGNFIDTADMYSNGLSEEIIGIAIKNKRDKVVLATKCYFPTGDSPTSKGLSRKHIYEACDASLRKLKTDYIDLYQTHGPDYLTPMEETMKTLDVLVRQGKVRYIGCSNLHGWQIVKANGISAIYNLEKYISAQHLYNIIMRDVEREVIPAVEDQGMGLICWSPLASGMLSGKYKRSDKPPSGSRMEHRAEFDVPRYWHNRGFKIVDAVKKEAKKLGWTPAQVSLSWLLYNKNVTAVIIGARQPEQIEDTIKVGELDIPEEVWKRIDKVSHFEPGYPKSWFELVKKNVYKEVIG